MVLSFVPRPGSIVMCDFDGHVEPEMVKKRRVVVVSVPRTFRRHGDATVIVVPLSETAPSEVLPWHHRIPKHRYRGLSECWAKADLVTHVAVARLDRILDGRRWIVPVVNATDLRAIRHGVAAAIGLDSERAFSYHEVPHTKSLQRREACRARSNPGP